jgi:hypothetical protein
MTEAQFLTEVERLILGTEARLVARADARFDAIMDLLDRHETRIVAQESRATLEAPRRQLATIGNITCLPWTRPGSIRHRIHQGYTKEMQRLDEKLRRRARLGGNVVDFSREVRP